MSGQPSKYDTNYDDGIGPGIRYVVRFDKDQGHLTRFIIQLQRCVDIFADHWKTFAQIDHEPDNPKGHDLYAEGIHVDIYHDDGGESKIHPPFQSGFPALPGVFLNVLRDYLVDNVEYFRQAARKDIPLTSPPHPP